VIYRLGRPGWLPSLVPITDIAEMIAKFDIAILLARDGIGHGPGRLGLNRFDISRARNLAHVNNRLYLTMSCGAPGAHCLIVAESHNIVPLKILEQLTIERIEQEIKWQHAT
jgi:hypothetical protein